MVERLVVGRSQMIVKARSGQRIGMTGHSVLAGQKEAAAQQRDLQG